MKSASLVAILASTFVLSGCSVSTGSTEDKSDKYNFPSIDESWVEEGIFIEPQNVLYIKEKQSKVQVRQLLGSPHFSEGFFGVKKWNYIFNFYTGQGSAFITCQYQVIFNDNYLVKETHWKRDQCSSLVMPKVHKKEGSIDAFTFDGDIMFDFDSSNLSFEGRRALKRIANKVLQHREVTSVLVVGHTDRLGVNQYNMKLSQERANTAGRYLIKQGVNPRKIKMLGKGSESPIVHCDGSKTTYKLKECMSPNRRVEIKFSAKKFD